MDALCVVRRELRIDQRSRLPPVTLDGSWRATKHVGGLFDRQTREESQLDEAAQGFIQPRQPVEYADRVRRCLALASRQLRPHRRG